MWAQLNTPAGCDLGTSQTPKTGAWTEPPGWLLTLREHPCFPSHTGETPILPRPGWPVQRELGATSLSACLALQPDTAELRF